MDSYKNVKVQKSAKVKRLKMSNLVQIKDMANLTKAPKDNEYNDRKVKAVD